MDSVSGGIVAGTEQWAQWNTDIAFAAAEDLIDPTSNGFTVNETGTGSGVNVSGANYIYLAFA
jgi:hypothetical protein